MLSAHTPLELSDLKRESVTFQQLDKHIVREFAEGELLAHHVAYKLAKLSPNKIDNIYIKSNHKKYTAQPIQGVAKGLVAFILTQENKDLKLPSKEVRVLFRGTKGYDSIRRDLESGSAGAISFKNSQSQLKSAVSNVLLDLIAENPEVEIALHIDGHSLGAADAQRMYVELMEMNYQAHTSRAMAETLAHFKNIKKLSLFCCNAPGVSKDTLEKANSILANMRALPTSQKPQLTIDWLHAAGDPVQMTGQGHILDDAERSDVEVRLVKVHAVSEYIWKNITNMFQASVAAVQIERAHCTHYFNHQFNVDESLAKIMEYEVLYNDNLENIARISSKLQKSTPIPKIGRLIQAALTPTVLPSDDYVSLEQDNEGHTRQEIVPSEIILGRTGNSLTSSDEENSLPPISYESASNDTYELKIENSAATIQSEDLDEKGSPPAMPSELASHNADADDLQNEDQKEQKLLNYYAPSGLLNFFGEQPGCFASASFSDIGFLSSPAPLPLEEQNHQSEEKNKTKYTIESKSGDAPLLMDEKKSADQTINDLLTQLDNAEFSRNTKAHTALLQAAKNMATASRNLTSNLTTPDSKQILIESLTLSVKLINSAENSTAFTDEITNLQNHIKTHPYGKSILWKQVVGALALLAGAAVFCLGMLGVIPTFGFSIPLAYPASGLLGAAGITLLFTGRQKGTSKAMTELTKKAACIKN